MIADAFLNSLRIYREPHYTKEKIAENFPVTLANCCRTMKVTNILGKPQGLLYDWGQFQAFQSNLGITIYNEKYDYLDDTIIDFFNSYNYKIITPKGQRVMFTVEFSEDATNVFRNKCNASKNKEWNEIIDPFLDALSEFLKTATVHGDNLEEWH